jgi:hypothetical protein
VVCFERHSFPKASQQCGEREEIPLESRGRDPPADSACGDSSGQSVSRLVSMQRAAILSDVIINEKLKLLQINYLV